MSSLSPISFNSISSDCIGSLSSTSGRFCPIPTIRPCNSLTGFGQECQSWSSLCPNNDAHSLPEQCDFDTLQFDDANRLNWILETCECDFEQEIENF